MSSWRYVITLISDSPDPPQTSENGFPLPQTKTERVLFCDKKSISQSEFYQSQQAGIKAELKFVLRSLDYEGETEIKHEGKYYRVLRTYSSKNGEFIELTVTDLGEA